MTTHAADMKLAARIRAQQIELAHAQDLVRRSKPKPKPPSMSTLMADSAATMPLAQLETLLARIDLDGTGTLNANDFNAFNNAYQIANDWLESTKPVTNLAAVVNGQNVGLSWTLQADPAGLDHYNVIRNGAIVGSASPTATAYTDTSPGPGTWTYQLQAISTSYEGRLSQPSTAVVAGQPPVPTAGWTDLTLPAGAVAVFVSSTGNDANAGTQAAPLRTLAAGYAKLRDGQPDQLLLKSGDTWNEAFPSWRKSANSTTKYMVVGAYGTGPRPKIRTGANQSVIHGGTHPGKGLAIVDLDVKPTSPTSGAAGFGFFQPWEHILIEGCLILGYPDNVQMQEVGAGRLNDIKIRRCIIADSVNTAFGHSQGIFFGSVDNWLIEECVLDNNARAKADMFCHNAYIHETSGQGTFRNNITSRACSHGGQQRPGGITEGNLCLQNPINFYSGGSGTNLFRRNIALDSRDINSIDRRGFGFVIGGGAGSVVEFNIAAHQVQGKDAVIGFNLDGYRGAFRDNLVNDWKAPNNEGWATAVQIDGSAPSAFTGNRLYMQNNGMMVRFETGFGGTFAGNRYFTTTPDGGVGGYLPFADGPGNGLTRSGWRSRTGEPASVMLTSAPPPLDLTIGSYLTRKGVAPGSDSVLTFCNLARANNKADWKEAWTALGVNTELLQVAGV